MYKNLSAEMKRFGVTYENVKTLLKCSERTVKYKIKEANTSNFTIDEAINIRDSYFPGMRLEYLFAHESAS